MDCPACKKPMISGMASTRGASAYRSAGLALFRCTSCPTTVLELARLGEYLGKPKLEVRGTLIERDVESTHATCGQCAGPFPTVTLSWGSDWVEVEHCDSCDVVALGPDEFEKLERIVRATVDLL